jgi:hypothetical protein
MSPAPNGHGIGKHGDTIAKQSTGFDLQQKRLISLLQKEVKPAVPESDFPPDDPGIFQTGNPSLVNQLSYDLIGPMGMQQDRYAFPFNGNTKIGKFDPPVARILDQIERPARQQKLPKLSRVRQIGFAGLPTDNTANDKAVRSFQKSAFLDIFKM